MCSQLNFVGYALEVETNILNELFRLEIIKPLLVRLFHIKLQGICLSFCSYFEVVEFHLPHL